MRFIFADFMSGYFKEQRINDFKVQLGTHVNSLLLSFVPQRQNKKKNLLLLSPLNKNFINLLTQPFYTKTTWGSLQVK
ncbi:hypothetical protein BpHYR1_035599 [Brachionus plicatilis]|uniref:Uncharacterized protein n=1 Tax=Brachionus plicatilis TaxID=10195 RepID=A0A3M7R9R6_BRAPC|nr:hypothetical protein BpHYR1_035599 [Brachionus plicatilis]